MTKKKRVVFTTSVEPPYNPDTRVGHVWHKDELHQARLNGLEIEAACGARKIPAKEDGFDILCAECERIGEWIDRKITVNPTNTTGMVFVEGYHVGTAVLYDHNMIHIQALGKAWWIPNDLNVTGETLSFVKMFTLEDIPETAEDFVPDYRQHFTKLVM